MERIVKEFRGTNAKLQTNAKHGLRLARTDTMGHLASGSSLDAASELRPAPLAFLPVSRLGYVRRVKKDPDVSKNNASGVGRYRAFIHSHRNQSHLLSSRISTSSVFSRASLSLRALSAAASPTRYGSSSGRARSCCPSPSRDAAAGTARSLPCVATRLRFQVLDPIAEVLAAMARRCATLW